VACGGAAAPAGSAPSPTAISSASGSAQAKPSAAASGVAKPAGSAAAAKPAANAAHVKLGYNPILAGAAMYFAQDRGYFAQQNLDVEFIPFDSGALMIAPLSAGQLDAIPATPSPGLFNAMARDVTLKAVAANNLTNATLVVRKDLADSGQVKT